MALTMKYTNVGGKALKLNKGITSLDGFTVGTLSLFPNLTHMNREHRESKVHTQKRRVKPKWLISNIPSGGAKAREILKERKKWPILCPREASEVMLVMNRMAAVKKKADAIPWKILTMKKGQKGGAKR